MSEEALLWSQSADAWIQQLEHDTSRHGLLDRRMLEAMGDVQGLLAADIGCGEGRFSRMLQERGARTVGVEPTPELLAEARRLDPSGTYIGATAETMELPEDLDWAVFYLSLVDISDIGEAIERAARALRPDARIINANLNPFVTCFPHPWHEDAQGQRLHIMVDDYPRAKAQRVGWRGIDIINYHRPLEQLLAPFLAQGLILESYWEPTPTDEEVDRWPAVETHRRVPLFHIQVWRKPCAPRSL
jgi:SAM-dependent methyltransferase